MTTPYQEMKLTDQYGPPFYLAWQHAAHGQLCLWERLYRCQGCGKEMTLGRVHGQLGAPAGPCPGCGGTLLAQDR